MIRVTVHCSRTGAINYRAEIRNKQAGTGQIEFPTFALNS